MSKKKLLILDQASKVQTLAECLQDFGDFVCQVVNIDRQLCEENVEELMQEVKPDTEIALVEAFYFLNHPEVIKKIAEKIKYIIAYTTLRDSDGFNSLLEQGILKKFLHKPMHFDFLIREIQEVCKAVA